MVHRCTFCSSVCTADRSLHRFPADPTRRNKWCSILNWKVEELRGRVLICSDHFRKKDYKGMRLKTTALPLPHITITKNPQAQNHSTVPVPLLLHGLLTPLAGEIKRPAGEAEDKAHPAPMTKRAVDDNILTTKPQRKVTILPKGISPMRTAIAPKVGGKLQFIRVVPKDEADPAPMRKTAVDEHSLTTEDKAHPAPMKKRAVDYNILTTKPQRKVTILPKGIPPMRTAIAPKVGDKLQFVRVLPRPPRKQFLSPISAPILLEMGSESAPTECTPSSTQTANIPNPSPAETAPSSKSTCVPLAVGNDEISIPDGKLATLLTGGLKRLAGESENEVHPVPMKKRAVNEYLTTKDGADPAPMKEIAVDEHSLTTEDEAHPAPMKKGTVDENSLTTEDEAHSASMKKRPVDEYSTRTEDEAHPDPIKKGAANEHILTTEDEAHPVPMKKRPVDENSIRTEDEAHPVPMNKRPVDENSIRNEEEALPVPMNKKPVHETRSNNEAHPAPMKKSAVIKNRTKDEAHSASMKKRPVVENSTRTEDEAHPGPIKKGAANEHILTTEDDEAHPAPMKKRPVDDNSIRNEDEAHPTPIKKRTVDENSLTTEDEAHSASMKKGAADENSLMVGALKKKRPVDQHILTTEDEAHPVPMKIRPVDENSIRTEDEVHPVPTKNRPVDENSIRNEDEAHPVPMKNIPVDENSIRNEDEAHPFPMKKKPVDETRSKDEAHPAPMKKRSVDKNILTTKDGTHPAPMKKRAVDKHILTTEDEAHTTPMKKTSVDQHFLTTDGEVHTGPMEKRTVDKNSLTTKPQEKVVILPSNKPPMTTSIDHQGGDKFQFIQVMPSPPPQILFLSPICAPIRLQMVPTSASTECTPSTTTTQTANILGQTETSTSNTPLVPTPSGISTQEWVALCNQVEYYKRIMKQAKILTPEQKQINSLRSQVRSLKSRLNKCRTKLDSIPTAPKDMILKLFGEENNDLKDFLVNQFERSKKKAKPGKRGKQYNNYEISFAFKIFEHCRTKGYTYLRKFGFNLPHLTTIKRMSRKGKDVHIENDSELCEDPLESKCIEEEDI